MGFLDRVKAAAPALAGPVGVFYSAPKPVRRAILQPASKDFKRLVPGDTFLEDNAVRSFEFVAGTRGFDSFLSQNVRAAAQAGGGAVGSVANAVGEGIGGAASGAAGSLNLKGLLLVGGAIAAGAVVLAVVAD